MDIKQHITMAAWMLLSVHMFRNNGAKMRSILFVQLLHLEWVCLTIHDTVSKALTYNYLSKCKVVNWGMHFRYQ